MALEIKIPGIYGVVVVVGNVVVVNVVVVTSGLAVVVSSFSGHTLQLLRHASFINVGFVSHSPTEAQ